MNKIEQMVESLKRSHNKAVEERHSKPFWWWEWTKPLANAIKQKYNEARYELRHIGIPKRIRALLDGQFSEPYMHGDICKAFDKGASIVLLYGSTGTGKSVAAAYYIYKKMLDTKDIGTYRDIWMDNRLRLNGSNSKWITTSNYCDLDKWSDGRKEILNCSFLVLDDMGIEIDPRDRRLIDNLIQNRCDECLETIITTNLSKKDFKELYSQRLNHRLGAAAASIECSKVLRPQGVYKLRENK